jgi:hypothetical protein
VLRATDELPNSGNVFPFLAIVTHGGHRPMTPKKTRPFDTSRLWRPTGTPLAARIIQWIN